MKSLNVLILVVVIQFVSILYAQTPEDFGFRHFQYVIEGDTVDVLVKSKKGEEKIKKPLFFAVQGSLAFPLIVHNGEIRTSFTVLEEDFVEDDYHLVMVNKPGVPLIAHTDSLVNGEYFVDKENYRYSEAYLKKNVRDYYVKRNLAVIDSLINKDWVDPSRLIVSGHSQGSGIAALICDRSTKPTHLIYSAGLPYFSTMLAILHQERMKEGVEPNPKVEKLFKVWNDVLKEPYKTYDPHRDSNATLYSFSQNENEILKRLKIPVLISYGTKDESYPYQDMFQLEVMRDRLQHITFTPYVGLGHNYQMRYTDENGKPLRKDYLKKVINDWKDWININ